MVKVILNLTFWNVINCLQQLGFDALKNVLKKRGRRHLASALYGYRARFLALIGLRVIDSDKKLEQRDNACNLVYIHAHNHLQKSPFSVRTDFLSSCYKID